MSQPGPSAPRHAAQALTQEYRDILYTAPVGSQTPSRPCPVDVVQGSGPCPVRQTTHLLRHRLRLAVLLTMVAFATILASILLRDGVQPTTWISLTLLACVLALLAFESAILWSRLKLSLPKLRVLEVVAFGAVGAFFAWLQIHWMHEEHVLGFMSGIERTMVCDMLAGSTALRWFVLLVIYGTFIPNTWRRCMVVVGIIAATPLVIVITAGIFEGNLTSYLSGMVIMVVVVALGAAIAVFGTHKMHELSKQVFEAKQLGQYRLKKLLGSGGMGDVYLAEHLLLRRPCAIKLIRPENNADPASLSRFEREVRATATLTHWNTVEIYDYGRTTDGTFYYVMEYLPGMSIEEIVLRDGPLPPARAVHLLRQVCAGLREAHGIGLIHRDIKPSNILACARGGVPDVAKLLDFGLVQNNSPLSGDDRLTVQGTILGSPPYMSPEQATGKGLDARTDIYSLGAVAYFMLAGHAPFLRETPMLMLMAHVYDPPRPITDLEPRVPADLAAVVMRCLEKDPERRFPDVRSMEHALAKCACAGSWSEEAAAGWWRDKAGDRIDQANVETPAPNHPVGMVTAGF